MAPVASPSAIAVPEARRRFTGEFKAKVASEALRGDKTIQEIAVRHKVRPNQVSALKQRAVEGVKEVFSKGAERSRGDHEGEAAYVTPGLTPGSSSGGARHTGGFETRPYKSSRLADHKKSCASS